MGTSDVTAGFGDRCNAPATITPPQAPISFRATSMDGCEGSGAPVVMTYDCYMFTRNGKRVDKKSSCVIGLQGDTITVVNSGGVGDIIEWTVEATDSSGNRGRTTCKLTVQNPAKGGG